MIEHFQQNTRQNENLNLISFTCLWLRMDFHKASDILNISSQSSTCCTTELLDQDGRRLREGCEEVSRGRCFWFFPQLGLKLRWLHCYVFVPQTAMYILRNARLAMITVEGLPTKTAHFNI